MKKLLFLFLAFPLLAISPKRVTIAWDAPDFNSVDRYYVFYTTNVAGPWTHLTNTTGTNVSLDILPAAYFFYVVASNLWGLSDPSNLATTPPAPKSSTNTTIKITP